MIVLAAMMVIYGICCFGDMRKPAILYFFAAILNAAVYPTLDALDAEADKYLIDWIYIYGVTESYLKVLFLLWAARVKYRWLIYLLFFHIVNDAFNSFHYGLVNDAIIVCEIICFIRGSKSVFVGIADRLFTRDLRRDHIGRGIL